MNSMGWKTFENQLALESSCTQLQNGILMYIMYILKKLVLHLTKSGVVGNVMPWSRLY